MPTLEIDAQKSAAIAPASPLKPRGPMPMIEMDWLLSLIVRPTTFGSEPNRVRHALSVTTAVIGAPTVSFSASNQRPREGERPSAGK